MPEYLNIIPEGFSSATSGTNVYEVIIVEEDLDAQLQICNQKRFTGRLTIGLRTPQDQQWSLYFQEGLLVGGTSEFHHLRRWYRQLSKHCPQIAIGSTRRGARQLNHWDYLSLVQLLSQEKLQQSQLEAVVTSNVTELLFDLIQSLKKNRYFLAKLQLTFTEIPAAALGPSLVTIDPDSAFQQASRLWEDWCQAGLRDYSPNSVPRIRDAQALRQQTSPMVYQNLSSLIDGDRTCRDLAVSLKQHLVPLTQSLIPYVNAGIIEFVKVEDWMIKAKPNSSHSSVQTLTPAQSLAPLVAYIEDSLLDSMLMGKVLDNTYYRFINIQDSSQALPILLEQKPSLIFLDLLMPITNGYELCAQIRRVSAFKETPVIIVTSSDGLIDRVRAKLVGASGFIAKPIEAQKVLNALNQHVQPPQRTSQRERQARPNISPRML
jgi:chemotaxis family two-component system response regulator PixG